METTYHWWIARVPGGTSGASTAPGADRHTSAAIWSSTAATACWRSTGGRRRPSPSTPPPRVPSDFLALGAALPGIGAQIPDGVRRAPWPPAAAAVDEDGVGTHAVALARVMEKAAGSVALVTPDRWMDRVRAALAGTRFADATAGPLSAGINLVDLRVVKGLEFDAIVVVDPAAILAQPLDGGVGGLYTALTRSTRALAIVHPGPLPPSIGDSELLRRIGGSDPAAAWSALGAPA